MCLGCLQHANNSHIVQIRSYEWIGFARQPLLLSVTVKQFRGSVQSTIRSQTVNTSESLCPCAMHLHYARRALLCSHCRTSLMPSRGACRDSHTGVCAPCSTVLWPRQDDMSVATYLHMSMALLNLHSAGDGHRASILDCPLLPAAYEQEACSTELSMSLHSMQQVVQRP